MEETMDMDTNQVTKADMAVMKKPLTEAMDIMQ